MATLSAPWGAREHAKDWRSDRLFYAGFAAASAVVVFIGFAPTYYLRSVLRVSRLPQSLHLHAALFTVWIVLFAVQVALIATRRTRVHRRLGVVGVLLAAAMVTAGYATAIDGARAGWSGANMPRDMATALEFLIVPLSDLLVFVGFFTAAVYFRRQSELHKRFMVLAMVGGVLGPAFSRIPLPWGLLLFVVFMLAGPVYDRVSRGRVHRAYLWGATVIVILMPLRAVIATQSEAWRRFAAWLTT
jgi:hypothetical protein